MGALRRALVPLLRDPGDTAISPSILLYANSLEPLEQPSSPQLWSSNNAQLDLNLQPVSSESAWSLTLASFQRSCFVSSAAAVRPDRQTGTTAELDFGSEIPD